MAILSKALNDSKKYSQLAWLTAYSVCAASEPAILNAKESSRNLTPEPEEPLTASPPNIE